MWETWTTRVNMTWDQWVASWSSSWDWIVWYTGQLGLSFYATVISPRPLGVMLTPILMVLGALILLWALCHTVSWLISIFSRRRRRAARLGIMSLRHRHFTPAERVAYQRLRMEDMLIKDIETLHYNGDLNEDECAWWYRELATKVGLPGLVHCYKEHLKKEIQERRRRGESVGIRNNRVTVLNKAQEQGMDKANTLTDIIDAKYGKQEPETLGEILEQK